MKKLGLFFTVLALTVSLSTTGISAQTKPLSGMCIVMVHGILGFDDTNGLLNGLVKYWGGLDQYLRDQGAKVATPASPAMASLATRASETIKYLEGTSTNPGWRIVNGCTKVHLIGHSQGGLVSRYMVKNLNYASKVATLTSVNTPHKGSPVADVVLNLIPDWLKPFTATVLNTLAKLIYRDGRPQDVLAMGGSLTVSYLKTYNANTPNVTGVKYYSYGSTMAWADLVQHPIMGILYTATWAGGLAYGMGSANDGIVPFSSQKWGTWKGEPSVKWYATGIDHLQATNFEWTGQFYYDVNAHYLKIAQNAKAGL
jgi:triacylglycerol lipase